MSNTTRHSPGCNPEDCATNPCWEASLPGTDDADPDPTPRAGIEILRSVVKWADWQREDHWLPEDGKDPNVAQIVQLYTLCLSWDVETPEDLASHDDPRARAAWETWYAHRG